MVMMGLTLMGELPFKEVSKNMAMCKTGLFKFNNNDTYVRVYATSYSYLLSCRNIIFYSWPINKMFIPQAKKA